MYTSLPLFYQLQKLLALYFAKIQRLDYLKSRKLQLITIQNIKQVPTYCYVFFGFKRNQGCIDLLVGILNHTIKTRPQNDHFFELHFTNNKNQKIIIIDEKIKKTVK